MSFLAAYMCNMPVNLNVTEIFVMLYIIPVHCLGIPVYSEHAIAAYFAYFAKMRISHVFPHIMAFSGFQYSLQVLFSILCKVAKNSIIIRYSF